MRWVLLCVMLTLAWPALPAESGGWKITELPGDVATRFQQTTHMMTDGEVNLRAVHKRSLTKKDTTTQFYSLPVKAPGLRPMPDGLPDGGVAEIDRGDIRSAYYSKPVTHYPHGALGDDIEAGVLIATNESGDVWVAPLKPGEVFEDRTPRLADLDGFGKNAIVTILTDVSRGASLSVFNIFDGKLLFAAGTPFIGTPNRWLNIAGIADFDGSGSSSIAVVAKPHIGGTLQFWRWSTKNGEPDLTLTAEAPGFSNHEFGSREQRLSAVEDFDNDGVDDLAVPSFDRRSLRLVKLSGGKNPKVEIMAEVALPAAIDKAIGVSRNGDDVVLTVGLEDGSVWAVHR